MFLAKFIIWNIKGLQHQFTIGMVKLEFEDSKKFLQKFLDLLHCGSVSESDSISGSVWVLASFFDVLEVVGEAIGSSKYSYLKLMIYPPENELSTNLLKKTHFFDNFHKILEKNILKSVLCTSDKIYLCKGTCSSNTYARVGKHL